MQKRNGLDVIVDGVLFTLVKWEFNGDGWAGHIYFKIPDGVYEYGANNGAYHYADPDPQNDEVPNANMATPCMEHGGDFASMPFFKIIEEAAQDIASNLSRKK